MLSPVCFHRVRWIAARTAVFTSGEQQNDGFPVVFRESMFVFHLPSNPVPRNRQAVHRGGSANEAVLSLIIT